jgi:hypothetical protein
VSLFSSSDVAAFKADRLLLAAQTYFPTVELSDTYLLQQMQASEAEIARRLKVYLEPTTIFPYEPTDDELTAIGEMPYDEEPGYDYDAEFFRSERWGFMVTRARPIISVEFLRFSYPNPQATFFTIPADWLRIDKKRGQINLVPASASFNAPLNAFMLQAMGGGGMIPFALQLKYVAGLKDVKTDPRWADLMDVIQKQAVLNVIDGSFQPQSGSISVDGMSQSISMDASKYRDLVEMKINGPKGSNGGLWTAIHGMVMGVAGVSI